MTPEDDWNTRHTTEPNIWQQLQELIDQSGRDEIVIQQQAERIRDLEAEIAAWKIWAASTKEKHEALEAEYLRLNKLPWKQAAKFHRTNENGNLMAFYDLKAMLNVEHLRSERAEAEIERLKAADAELRERLRLCEKTNKYFAKQMNWGTP